MTNISEKTTGSCKDREYIVTEVCPHCEAEVEMRWNVAADGYKAFCPHCGNRLMLCDECRQADETDGRPHVCDHDSETDTCKHNKGETCEWGKPAPQFPFFVLIDDDGTAMKCENFYQYACAGVLPDPTIVEMSDALNDWATDLIQRREIGAYELFRALKPRGGFTEWGRETLEFPELGKAQRLLAERKTA